MTTHQKIKDWLGLGEFDPYDFQWDIYEKTIEHIRNYDEPAYIYGSVSCGKTSMQAMIAKHGQVMAEQASKQQMPILCLARTGELVEQNAAEMWGINARNSVFSSSVGVRSTHYPVIVGSEGTVCRSLHGELKDYKPRILLIDECHQFDWEDYLDDNSTTQYALIIKELQKRCLDTYKKPLIIIGYTGSPWRSTTPILGKFWAKELYKIDMWELVKRGKVHEPIFGFGHDEIKYDYSPITQSDKDGTEDFGKEALKQMQQIALADPTVTQKIMREVVDLTKTRNCVLVTCAGSKHIKECIAALPEYYSYDDPEAPDGALLYATINEKTKFTDRRTIKKGCDTGKIKFVFQIGCWTVGVNIPPIDTIVILRRIGSLTLLTQLIGRAIRLLKQSHKDMGMIKENALVLDYSDTMDAMAGMFMDGILEAATLAKAKQELDTIPCPDERCGAINSSRARRCVGADQRPMPVGRLAPDPRGRYIGGMIRLKQPDGRCGHFWSAKKCPQCGIENDKVARSCRYCDFQLVDPNKALNGKHYTDDDWKPVIGHNIQLTNNQKGIIFTWQLPNEEVAKEVYFPSSEHPAAKKIWWNNFVIPHVAAGWRKKIYGLPAVSVFAQKAIIDIPTHITHRINDKGESVIHRRKFGSGRES